MKKQAENGAVTSDTITGVRARWYNRLMGVFGAERVYRKALELLLPRAGEHILDIGCGTGTFLKLVRESSGVPLNLVGVDASDDMLREARKNADATVFMYADAAVLPFPDRQFDAVVSILALHHMPEEVKRRAIGEAIRVLSPGGRIVIADLLRVGSWWGRIPALWIRFHSYTRGNWELITHELLAQGFSIGEEGTVRGAVGILIAKRH